MLAETEKELDAFASERGTLISVGVFDGVHAGHSALIRRLVTQAKEKDLLSAVVIFKPHPVALLSDFETRPPMLSGLDARVRLIRELGADMVIPLTFSRELADSDARSFVQVLRKRLNMQGMVLGWASALGRKREGTLAVLRELGSELGFGVEEVSPVSHQGEIISSTAVRQALAKGDMAKVAAMLGRPFSLEGAVVSGDQRGRLLGFPTANLALDSSQALPSDGTYAALAHFRGTSHLAAIHIGMLPTFNCTTRAVEVHVLDYTGDLYRESLRVDVLEWLRGERKFPDAAALKAQIAEDVAAIRKKLTRP